MDSDRKSTVSSFYGRKNSLDALNNDFPSPTTQYASRPPGAERPRADSFYNPEQASRGSVDILNNRASTAGYNQGSFFHAGREEPLKGGRDEEELLSGNAAEESWDVYADFNNAGPKYSTAFGQPSQGYHQIETPKIEETASTTGPVEMVTVPALGPEWRKSEMRDMTKAGKREKKAESRRQKWKEFNRGERGLCGRTLTRKVLAFVLFGLAVAVGIIIAFTIPRVPSFSFSNDTPLANATGSWKDAIPAEFSRSPANFSFPAFAALQVNTGSNYLPIKFKHLRAKVYDLTTERLIGSGDYTATMPAKSLTNILLPLNFTYSAINDTDTTWVNWYDACRNLEFANPRPGIGFRLVLDIDIRGLPSAHTASTQISSASCPIELPLNSV